MNKVNNHQNCTDCAQRQLALVDKIIGLEAEVARLSIEGGVHDIRILRGSRAWRVGHFILSPGVKIRNLFRK